MTILVAAVAAFVFLIPVDALAWGFGTHIHIGMTIIEQGVSAAASGNPLHFLVGNIFPDLFNFMKDFSEFKKRLPTHSWQTVSRLFEAAETDAERAFAHGYAAHLSADIVAHNHFVPEHMEMVSKNRLFAHFIPEAAEEALHGTTYERKLPELLDASAECGALFMRAFGVNAEWFAREVGTLKTVTGIQRRLRLSRLAKFIRSRRAPDFAERCVQYHERALELATNTVSAGHGSVERFDPSGKMQMVAARKRYDELLEAIGKRGLRDMSRKRLLVSAPEPDLFV